MWKKFKISPTLNTWLIWSLMATFAALDAVGLKAEGMSVAPKAILIAASQVSALLILSVIYTYFRRDARIAAMTHMAAVALTFSAVTAICSYMTVAWQRPLVDAYLVAADHALGLDWLTAYKWVMAHSLVHKVLWAAYASLIVQMILLILVLNFLGKITRGWEMMWLFMVACIGCLLLSAPWPAAGAFGYFHVEDDRLYVRAFMALHEGTLKIIGVEPIQGIVQFPSLHAALGIIFAYSARGIRFLFPFLLALNALLFIATPAIGGHHFADLWGGAALALVTILTVRKAFASSPLMAGTAEISPAPLNA
jgi:hypothetical protein